MAEVVNLYGQDLDPRTASEAIIKFLEFRLEQAKCGELVGVAMAFTYFDRSSGHARAGFVDAQLVGSTATLLHDLTKLNSNV